MCFLKGLRTLTISTQLGLVKTIQTMPSRGPCLWNNILTPIQKQCTSQSSFKKPIKETMRHV